MAEAAAIPLNPTMEHLPHRSTEQVEVYEIGYDSIDGLRIAEWYCVPKEAYLPPPYPGLLIVPGYILEPTLPKSCAKLGYAAIGVAPRGKLRSNDRFNPGYPGCWSTTWSIGTHTATGASTWTRRAPWISR